jgi:hypothetical protein
VWLACEKAYRGLHHPGVCLLTRPAPLLGPTAQQAVCHSITSCAADSPELLARLATGLLLVGPGGSLRGLGSMLERRLGQRLADAGRAQVCVCVCV